MTPPIITKKTLTRRRHKHFRQKKKGIKQMKVVPVKFDWNIVVCLKCDRRYFLKEAIKREGNGTEPQLKFILVQPRERIQQQRLIAAMILG